MESEMRLAILLLFSLGLLSACNAPNS